MNEPTARRRVPPSALVVLAGAALGLLFSAVSTHDFAQHLDRQVHSVSCSFVPGLERPDATGTSGCHAVMMSPYSSVFRQAIWGGIPISLPAMSVFAFLLFWTANLLLGGRHDDRRGTGFLLLAATLPLIASAVMATISFATIGTACKLCVGVYVASVVSFVGAFLLWRRAARVQAMPPAEERSRYNAAGEPAWARSPEADGPPPAVAAAQGGTPERRQLSLGALGAAFVLGVAFVALPVAAYAMLAPDHANLVGTCGSLAKPNDPYGVMVPLGPQGSVPAIEVLDPLCPACRAFEERLDATGLGGELARRAILFPLDNECNWMVSSAFHPGACAVSEAVLCAEGRAGEVITWAFREQERIRTAAAADPDAARRIVGERFPELARCVGSATARSRLNKSLRWAVANQLAVLTPQLYIDGVKVCDEDTDLGLDFVLAEMLKRHRAGTLGTAEVNP